MTTSFNKESLCNITLQHPITYVHSLRSGGLPSQCLLLHYRAIGGEVHTMKYNVVEETVAFHTADTKKSHYDTIRVTERNRKEEHCMK